MRQALLFWFYRDVGVCAERLRHLRALHPGQRIYGLYGGPEEEADDFERALSPWLDDFYVATRQPDPYLKWLQGDLEIVEWLEVRGRALDWESIAVVQWDLLVKAPLAGLLPGLAPEHLYFSGLRVLDAVLEARWYWTRQGNHQRSYRRFRAQIAGRFGFQGPPLCCLFIFAVLTRPFLEVYAREAPSLAGFLEYKLPTLARIHGFPCLVGDLGVLWDPLERAVQKPLSALPQPVPRAYVEAELARPDGFRLFHPVPYPWEANEGGA
jgi:hypothetical protein